MLRRTGGILNTKWCKYWTCKVGIDLSWERKTVNYSTISPAWTQAICLHITLTSSNSAAVNISTTFLTPALSAHYLKCNRFKKCMTICLTRSLMHSFLFHLVGEPVGAWKDMSTCPRIWITTVELQPMRFILRCDACTWWMETARIRIQLPDAIEAMYYW